MIFENIVPWNGEVDTGRDARLKLDRNFARIKNNFEAFADGLFINLGGIPEDEFDNITSRGIICMLYRRVAEKLKESWLSVRTASFGRYAMSSMVCISVRLRMKAGKNGRINLF